MNMLILIHVLNYVQFFIENKEKEFSDEKDNAKKNKIFVFIVYLSRIFETEKEDHLIQMILTL